ncbi:LIC_12097 family sensor histidine kinase [Leptospira kanakyensis]|uniref:histidine kinase n=1 Tax=Leptospira kanakyensis TaxID=2484968 RepID=A0A6N4QIQ2_9LEPT|nr:HAMP domain-containing sensor histidine kinase [Leptospira kanakyensis]MCW7471465.1 HAMP domain-containing histidine kinase [Leptospira kanakyensis]TGK51984.1 sensor histidine kinase [Leptospira kanakyensis]TGK57108.1 sensor histidine kinase [Leptospira kanakyensis]TGK71876.1 sensor histidine kinase [Leptospira kanakyensis]
MNSQSGDSGNSINEGNDFASVEKVAEKARELEAIYDVVQDPLVLIDSDFNIQRANLATILFAKNNKYDELLDRKCYEVLYQRTDICPYCPKINVKSKEKNQTYSTPITREIFFRSEDKKQTLLLEFYPYPKQEDLFWMVEKISDVTKQREKEEESFRMRNLASLGILISGIAHELNNPLTGISLTLQNLKANWQNQPPEQIEKRLDMIKNDISRAAIIVSDIISFAKTDKVKVTLGDIVETINRAKDTVIRLYPHLSKNIVWRIACDHDYQFPFHPGKMERLFMNLFRNSLQAFDYRPGEISIELRKTKNWLHIIVEDNAGGIPDAIIQKIFDPFFTSNKSGTGTGLGLSICHSIVKEHDGNISVKSSEQKTRFTISFPLTNDITEQNP